MEPKIYTAAIIGAGRIAAGFDAPGIEHVLTHAHAIANEPRLKLVAITDTDAEKGNKEAARWNTSYSADVAEMMREHAPDLVVIATPDDTHADVLLEVLACAPKLIILEKPVVKDQADASRIEDAVAVAGIPILVNFRRRFDPSVVALADELAQGTHGRVLSARGLYSKGVVHTGSHLLDLARFLFGEFHSGTASGSVQDWEGEPSVSGFATFERCSQFSLTAGDERAYSVFELEILTEKRRFRFRDEGMTLETEEVIDDPLYPGYKILGPVRAEPTGLLRAMSELAAHAVRVLDGTETPRATLVDALRTDAACRTFL
jgi:predicted dehydrogenase